VCASCQDPLEVASEVVPVAGLTAELEPVLDESVLDEPVPVEPVPDDSVLPESVLLVAVSEESVLDA
jgi:hypothetical protein